MTLFDAFVRPLAYARFFLDAPNADEAAFRAELEAQLATARRELAARGVPPAAIDNALFAVVAWLDETVMCADWPGAEAWRGHPLQKTYFNTTRAGVEFFTRLDALGRDEGAVREVYFLCLAMGFAGRYAAPGARLDLAELRARESRALLEHEQPLDQDTVLFPEAYAPLTTRPQRQRWTRWRPSRVTLLLKLVPLGVLALLYLIFHLVLKFQADELVRNIQARELPPPAATR